MINKRLIGLMGSSRKYIAGNVLMKWCALCANIALITAAAGLAEKVYLKTAGQKDTVYLILAAAAAIALRVISAEFSAHFEYLSSKDVKTKLRSLIYEKLLRLGSSYKEQIPSSEAVQLSTEGVEQLDVYFGAYLPQFFFSMLAPLTLFAVMCRVSASCAAVLLACVPLIPMTIAAVQTIAKKLLSGYWTQYASLGDTFLENLQGLTTLKIYQADAERHEKMNAESEKFRKITMKVLTMQLNSVTIMDVIALGGSALGIILALSQLSKGNITLSGCLMIILLSAEFFIPMRQLGSFFHVAMNGMAASDKIFKLLDTEEPADCRNKEFTLNKELRFENITFSYDGQRRVLDRVDMTVPARGLTAIVGESGSGKSTAAAVLMGRNRPGSGRLTADGADLAEVSEENILKNITYVGHDSYLFKGTVRENLQMGCPDAEEEKLWDVLERAELADFFRSEKDLDTLLTEKASNLSGGQRQRLALARALLHDSPVYVFDEAASNIDVESETSIMKQIYKLAEDHAVLLITHRLANAVNADRIYVFDKGRSAEHGTHEELLTKGGTYADLWNVQYSLEHFGTEGAE